VDLKSLGEIPFESLAIHWESVWLSLQIMQTERVGIEDIHFGGSIIPLAIIENLYLKKKLHLGPQNGPGSENLLKIVNCQNGQKTVLSHLEKVGGPRYPPGSILPP
jgi:hypothetical protein